MQPNFLVLFSTSLSSLSDIPLALWLLNSLPRQTKPSPSMSLIEMIASPSWQGESYPVFRDFLALPFLVVFFPAVRLLLDRFIFEKIARRLVPGKGHKKLNVEAAGRRRKLDKFKESAWKFIYFLSSELLVLSVTYDEPWFTNSQNFWVGPGDQVWPDQKMKLKLKGVYMYAAGFYTYSIFALLFWETRRSDFWVSISHHVATVALIILSYIFRFARVGSMVLALHDATDIFMEAAKMCKYSGLETPAQILFILFDLVWVLLRLTYFPFWILRSTSYEVILTLDKEKHKVEGPIYYYVFNTLLFALLIIHIYWSVLIFGMILRQLQSGQLEGDVRSDSEGEDEHED